MRLPMDDRGMATKDYAEDRDHQVRLDQTQFLSDRANAAYDVCYNVADIDDDVPSTFWEAMQSADAEQWLEACKKEINNLQLMKCYR
ncbi:unnamed protein product, partial [Aphanomyces euteiches]